MRTLGRIGLVGLLVLIGLGHATAGHTAANPATATPPGPLYTADWSRGMNGWASGADWKWLGGMLLNDGTDDHGGSIVPIAAPYEPGSINDYAVEAEIRVIADGVSFGLVARRTRDGAGYAAGPGDPSRIVYANRSFRWDALGPGRSFAPKRDWHRYRVEVRGNVVTFLADNAELATVTDNRYLDGGAVGIWCNGYQLEIRSFQVLRLS